MIPVRLSKDAAIYIRKETEYLRQRNPTAAGTFLLAMKNARKMLQTFPAAGTQRHGLSVAGSRTLIVGDYLLDYLFDGAAIAIILVRHGRMLAQTPEVDRDEVADLEASDE